MKNESLTPLYYNLIRIHTTEPEESDWFGWFGDNGVIEGFGYKAVIQDALLKIVPVRPSPRGGGYISRFWPNHITYTKIEDLVMWSRPYDKAGDFPTSDERVVVPCLRTSRMTYEALLTEPEYGSVQRTIVTLTPVLKNGLPDIDVSCTDESEEYRKARSDEHQQKVLMDIVQSLEA